MNGVVLLNLSDRYIAFYYLVVHKNSESTKYKDSENTKYKDSESTKYKDSENTKYKDSESTKYKDSESTKYKDGENTKYKGQWEYTMSVQEPKEIILSIKEEHLDIVDNSENILNRKFFSVFLLDLRMILISYRTNCYRFFF